MSGHISPVSSCDATCAAINGCAIGGVQCAACDRYFCIDELDVEGVCSACAKERHVCAHCGGVFYDEGYTDFLGDYDEDFCSEGCFEAWLENQNLEGLEHDGDGPVPSADGSGL